MGPVEIVIIGAGFAGASTAYHLVRLGIRDILILEQEDFPGVHASGRNAGMIHQIVSDERMASLVREGAAFIHRLPPDWPAFVDFRQNGSLLLGTGQTWKRLMSDAEKARKAGVPASLLPSGEVLERLSGLEGGDFEGAVWCPTDGVVDIHALLYGYLQLAQAGGARLLTSTKVLGILTQEKRVTAVMTEAGVIHTEAVVNAAGAWAEEIGRMGGAISIPIRSYRRHLLATGVLDWVRPQWPIAWDYTEDFYFRPESGGLLLSPCDAVEYPPGIPPTDPEAPRLLFEKLKRYPRLCDLPIKSSWAGLRTLSVDGRFVIGWDPLVCGFFWVAALGGYGVTASGAIGRLAANLLIHQEKEGTEDVSPGRFIRP